MRYKALCVTKHYALQALPYRHGLYRHGSLPYFSSMSLSYLSDMKYDVLVLGAGASGLFYGAHAAQNKRSICILDHAAKAAQKVMASGGGRCNFTNLFADAEKYLCTNPHFVKSALAGFTPHDALEFFSARGIEPVEKEAGQFFSAQGAGALARVLLKECHESGCEIRLNVKILGACRDKENFTVESEQGTFQAKSLVLALGGSSWPTLGSSDLGMRLGSAFGLKVFPPKPALVPLRLIGKDLELAQSLAGIALPVRLSMHGHEETGDVLFTHRGLSGPAVLQLSLYWHKNAEVFIDFLPSHDVHNILYAHKNSRKQLSSVLSKFLPSRFVKHVLEPFAHLPMARIDAKKQQEIAKILHSWRIVPSGTEGMKKAEVMAGGLDTQAFSSKSMEAKHVPGLFAIGEVLDVVGRLGGFNLHWAWASAFAAAIKR